MYSFPEKHKIILLSIAHKIQSNYVPQTLQNTDSLLENLVQQGIDFEKKDKLICFPFKMNDTSFNISLKRNSSDASVFNQICLQKEYESVIGIIKKYNIPCNLMIDAGANIGLTSIYFHSHFPEITIIALEPFNDTFQRLERNIKVNRIGNAHLVNKGLWSHKTRLSADYTFGDKQDWAFRLTESSNGNEANFETVSVIDLIQDFGLKTIDFLKIDIEGGETAVFDINSNMDWLCKVRLIAIEIHDEFDCRKSIEDILVESGFTLSYSGELTIGVNKNLLNNVTAEMIQNDMLTDKNEFKIS